MGAIHDVMNENPEVRDEMLRLVRESRDVTLPGLTRLAALMELSTVASPLMIEAAKRDVSKPDKPVYRFVNGAKVRVK